jgi:DNA-binding GntR family transcriptional regulator
MAHEGQIRHSPAVIGDHAINRAIRDGQPEAAAAATVIHLANMLEDYRLEIRRRVFGVNPPST